MIEHLIKMRENDLSENVIVPLLRKIHNCRVDFSGGSMEKGRDIIVYKKDEYGFNDYVGIQVKKTQATANSTLKSFQQLLNQISQMKNEGVIDPDTTERVHFRKLLFITPYRINDSARDSHSGALRKVIDEGVVLIDGLMLQGLIETHAPELIKVVKGEQSFLVDKTVPKLTNNSLMEALGFQDNRNLCDIYCDAGFTTGNKQYSIFMNKYFPVKVEKNTQVDAKIIYKIIKDSHQLYELLGVPLIEKQLINQFLGNLALRKKLLNEQQKSSNKIQKLRLEISEKIKVSEFNDIYPESIFNQTGDDFFTSGFLKEGIENTDFISEVIKLKDIFNLWLKEEQTEKKNEIDLIVCNNYSFKFQMNEICKAINKKTHSLLIDSNDAKNNLKSFLLSVSDTQKIIAILSRYEKYYTLDKRIESDVNIVPNYTISDVFNTRLNTVLLGEAGSGKTTNLQVYTTNLYKEQKDELIIYMTLDQLSGLASLGSEKCILKGIIKYLSNNGIDSYTTSTLTETFRLYNTTLILDSIDEAIVNNVWIIQELNEFSKYYPKCQIITSSRYTVNELEVLDFINVSLLPFNNAQKEEFFNKWFVDTEEKARDLINHLSEYPKLDSVVTNPLSATIMATLQDNKIPLPKTESSLYKKRFELLSGMFDKFKGVNRSIEQPETLLTCSQFLAYEIHIKGIRSFTKENIINILSKEFKSEYNIVQVVDELISPAEILLLNSNGEYGFGHLRFQEYLASKEFVERRDINYSVLLIKNWWHDVFILYAQHARKIDWLIEDITQKSYMTDVEKTIKEMIKFRPDNEQNSLLKGVQNAIWSENENSSGFNVFDDFNDFDNDY